MKYTDPTGHDVSCAGLDCSVGPPLVAFSGNWSMATWEYIREINRGAWTAASRLTAVAEADQHGGLGIGMVTGYDADPGRFPLSGLWGLAAEEVFRAGYGDITLVRSAANCADCWAETAIPNITIYANVFAAGSTYLQYAQLNTAHELGHAFAQRAGRQPYDDLDATVIRDAAGNVIAGGGGTGAYTRRNAGYVLIPTNRDPTWPWQQNTDPSANEDFADMFLNWSYRSFDNDLAGAGAARNQWMTTNMPGYIALVVAGNQ